MKNFLVLLLLAAYLSSCSTMGEAISSSDTTYGYKKVDVPGSQPKYVRKRIKPDPFVTSPIYNSPNGGSNTTDTNGLASNMVGGVFELMNAVANHVTEGRSFSKAEEYYGRPTSPGKIYLGLSFASSSKEGAIHSGFELEGNLAKWSSLRGGVSFVSSDRIYWGVDGGVRFFFPWAVSPYLGIGGYAGDSKSCTNESLSNNDILETCEKFFLFTFYPEAGVQWVVNDTIKITGYVRDYSRIDQKIRDRSYYLWGASVVIR